MEKWLPRVLNTLGVAALAATLVLTAEVWSLIRPAPVIEGLQDIYVVLKHHQKEEGPRIPPAPKKKLKGAPETARAVAVKVIERHIDEFMLKSFNGACGMDRQSYISAIAEALMAYAHDPEEAFWLAGMMQAESSYRLGARPGKSTNSSARGLLQVIVRWHQDVLSPVGITKELLASDVALSVQGGVLVFHKYRFPTRGPVRERSLEEATLRYRSLKASAKEHAAYQAIAGSVRDKLLATYRKEVNKK